MHLDEHGQVEPEFGQIIGGLAEAFGVKITAMRIKLYARALEDVTLEDVKTACMKALRESTFFPVPAELRKYVTPSGEDAALIAWSGFASAASSIGSWRTLQVDDGAAAEALVAVFGSWPHYCSLPEVAVASRRAEFIAAYRQARRGPLPPRLLVGQLGADPEPAVLRLGRPQEPHGHTRLALSEARAEGENEAPEETPREPREG